MSTHSFDPEVASEVGLNAAVIYQNIVFWCTKNAANEKNIRDGNAWTYNSMKAFEALFPYLSYDQIRRALEKLVDAGFIGAGSFNEAGYDRTKWYCVLRQMDLAKMPNGNGVKARPIPDSKPDSKPDTPQPPEGEPSFFSEMEEQKSDGDPFEIWWNLYPRNQRKAGKAKCREKFWATVKGKRKDVEDPVTPQQLIEALQAFVNTGPDLQYVCAPLVWLNGCKWEGYLGQQEQRQHRRFMAPPHGEVVR